jgi:hypothetical protein
MGWGFRKRAGLFGGLLRLNVSKHGLGASVGVPGLRVGVDSQQHGYVRGGVPGTGLFFTERMPGHARHTQTHAPQAGFWSIVVMAVFVAVWIFVVYEGTPHP